MINLVSIIQRLSETSSRNDKEAILTKAFTDKHFDLFRLLKYAYDPFITFGVADKMIPAEADGDSNLSFADFEKLLLKLKNRELTGNAAREALAEICLSVDPDVWGLICRPVLMKDMRAGFTDNTVNKVLKALAKKDKSANEYMIPTFDVQLAQDGADENITGKKIVQIKLDGVRLITICDKENNLVVQYTRNGKENSNFPHIKKVFEDLLPKLDKSMVFDGEVMSSSFQNLMTQVQRKDKVAEKNTYLALFDCLTLEEFRNEISKSNQLARVKNLDKLIENSEHIYKVPYKIVDLDTEEGTKEFSAFNQEAINAGYEGIMVKKLDSFYECKRTKSWLKIKPFISVSLPIIGHEEGSGKNQNALGAFECFGEDSSFEGKKIKVSCGGGYTDDQRKDFWKKRDDMRGMIIEIKADCLTLEEGSEIYSLRFPRFTGFRGTKPGEKI